MSLNLLTVAEAIEKLKKEEISSVDIVKGCFERIEEADSDVKAFISTRKSDALEEAEEVDKLIKEKGESVFSEKPLLGIPYSCKDNFSTKGIETTAGSNILKGYIPPYESTVTKKLKDAGAVLIGKTNMDAFAHGSTTENSDFFATKNPWDYTKVPGGSSGGSAAAVAANMCLFAMGSETAGSIRGPASWCGVTGFKPTYGRVSRYGLIAMASSTDSPGPITKSAVDASVILQIISGKDEKDATSSPLDLEEYSNLIGEVNIEDITIGVPRVYFECDIDNEVKSKVVEAIEIYKDLGAEVVDIDLMDPKYSIGVYTILQRSEVSSNLSRFDGIRFGHKRDKFGFEAKKRIMLGTHALSAGYYDQYYAKAQKVRTLIVDDFKRAFEKVDLIISPAMPVTAPKLGEFKSSPLYGELIDQFQEPSSIAGLCGVSLPCGFAEKMPVGFQLIGNYFDEKLVLAVGCKYQNATDFHTKFPELGEEGNVTV